MTQSITNTVSQGRPRVTIRAQTANTCDILIHTDAGDVRILAGHEKITVQAQAASPIEVEMQS